MATLIWRPCATCSAQSEWLCIIENAAPLKSARLRGFGGAACVLGEMCEGAGALARVLENEGCVPGRCIALSRRCVGALYRIVNCGPAKCCVWPVLAPAEGIVRAGSWSAGQSKSVAAFFVRIMTGVRFYWNVLRSIHACHAFLLECFSFDHAWCLPPVRFLMAIPTGNEETRERGERSRRRGARALLREHIGFAMFPAGSTLGQNVEAGTRV